MSNNLFACKDFIMEQMQLGYSMNNIPIASKEAYTKCLIEKAESVIRRMSWKVRHYENPNDGEVHDEAQENHT